MDDRDSRSERPRKLELDEVEGVDIRRTVVLGRDVNARRRGLAVALAPMHRVVHWGPIMAGVMTTLTLAILLGALFLGLGFEREYGIFGGLTTGGVGTGAAVATIVAVFAGAYLTGYASDLTNRSEGTLNGFMVGIMAILTPLLLALFGAYGNVNTAPNQVRGALTIAADNAWLVFVVGALILGAATLAGFLGRRSREMELAAETRLDVERAEMY